MIPFFFVPASKIDKVSSVLKLGVKHLIIDFEDSITHQQRIDLKHKIPNLDNYKNYWYRVPLRDSFKDEIDKGFFIELCKLGVTNFVLPKLKDKQEVDHVFNSISVGFNIILLIEHPKLLLELEEVMKDSNCRNIIYGFGLGSHDLVNELNANYSLEVLAYPRQKLKFIAAAYQKLAIDIASMDIRNKIKFEQELFSGTNFGYDAKFIVHPMQYQWLLEILEKAPDYLWAKKIRDRLEQDNTDHEPFKMDGEIIEKPHIQRALNILEKYSTYGK